MNPQKEFSKLGFLKTYLLPVIIIFLIPGFAWWFFNHVEASFDRDIRNVLLQQIRSDSSLSPEQVKRATQFYNTVPFSRIMGSSKPQALKLQANFSSVRTRYAIFRWMKRISFICLISSVAVFVAVSIGVAFSFRSPKAQYWSLRMGWHLLRWFALLQVLGQGILAVALSFWVTAFWMERYFVKLILIASIAAIGSALMLIAAIFRKLNDDFIIEGRLLAKEDSPAIWARVIEMSSKMAISPPDNIIVGIDDNFFVTEHPVKVSQQIHTGRTLFASLSLLQILTRQEAEAVLAHELAHFSGEDTLFSKRTSPLLGKYVHYLHALHQGGISRPVFYFMWFFWNLYQISLNKIRREREFRADKIGSEFTAAEAMSTSLVKIASYCSYRHKVQTELFMKQQKMERMNISERIEAGFPAFMAVCIEGKEFRESLTPHPFDTHPPLALRVKNLGLNPDVSIPSPANLAPVADSWFNSIESAPALLQEQWLAFENSFHEAHLKHLAWVFQPAGEEEIAHVLKYFPPLQYQGAKAITATLDYEKISVSGWDSPILFQEVIKCTVKKDASKLTINFHPAGGKAQSRVIAYKSFAGPGLKFFEAFQKYYSRHLTARRRQEEKQAPPEAA